MSDTHRPRHQDNTGQLREENLQLPTNLDEQSISNHLRMISRSNPQQLPATAQAIREKWAYIVGGWAERGRLEYLNTVLLQLQVSHDILTQSLVMDDEWQAHQVKKTTRRAEAVAGIPRNWRPRPKPKSFAHVSHKPKLSRRTPEKNNRT